MHVHAGQPLNRSVDRMMGQSEFDGLSGRVSQVNGLCRAAECKAIDMAVMRFSLDLVRETLEQSAEAEDKGGKGKDEKPKDEKKETRKSYWTACPSGLSGR